MEVPAGVRLLLLLVASVRGGKQCLRDFLVVGSTPETITVAWKYDCMDK